MSKHVCKGCGDFLVYVKEHNWWKHTSSSPRHPGVPYTFGELQVEIEETKKQIKSLRQRKKELSYYLAVTCCPFNVGDTIIETNFDFGENTETLKIVTDIEAYEFEPYYKIRAARIKKNGDPYNESNVAWGKIRKADEE